MSVIKDIDIYNNNVINDIIFTSTNRDNYIIYYCITLLTIISKVIDLTVDYVIVLDNHIVDNIVRVAANSYVHVVYHSIALLAVIAEVVGLTVDYVIVCDYDIVNNIVSVAGKFNENVCQIFPATVFTKLIRRHPAYIIA